MTGFVPPEPPPEEPAGSPPPPPPSWPPQYPTYGAPQHQDHSSALKEAEHTRKMAGWALGLSFAFFLPFAALTAIGLAITSLVQGSRARRVGGPQLNYGTGMAVAALPIAVVSMVIGVVLVVVGAMDDTDDNNDDDATERSPRTSEVDEVGQDVLPSRMREGDCFNEPHLRGLGPTEQFAAATVEIVPCKVPHDAEVYLAFQLPAGDFPGRKAIEREAFTCAKRFKAFVGVPYPRSDLDFIYFSPTERSWDILDDHGIACTVFDPTGKVSGTLQGSKR